MHPREDAPRAGGHAPWELRSPRSMWTHAPGAAITEGWLGLAECPIPAACKGEERRCQSKQQEGDQETATLPSPGRAQRMESKPPCKSRSYLRLWQQGLPQKGLFWGHQGLTVGMELARRGARVEGAWGPCFPNRASLVAQLVRNPPAMRETPVQFLGWEDPLEEGISPVAQSCPTLCDPMYCSKPGLPVHDQPLELAQAHVHRVGDAAQPSPPLPPLFLPPPILSPPPVFWPGESHGNLVAKSQTRLSDFHLLLACFPNRSSSGSGD